MDGDAGNGISVKQGRWNGGPKLNVAVGDAAIEYLVYDSGGRRVIGNGSLGGPTLW